MAKLVLAMFISLDGYTTGPNGEFVPPPLSAEVVRAWIDHNLKNAGHLIYGRINFEFNKAYWTSSAAAGRPETEAMNRLPKTVVSRSMSGDLGWNAKVATGDLAAVVGGLKQSVTQGEIYSFGGAGLAKSFMRQGLVDEYYLMVTSNLLGNGKRLFGAGVARTELELIQALPLDTGSVILHYRRK
ncbi:MAG: dihydrofolate reductase family protein [Nitrososphaera sp.]|jgi:dihydrofolate reductase